MLACSAILFGITIFLNGFIPIYKWDKRNLAVINAIVGIILLVINLYGFLALGNNFDNLNYVGGILFGLTNIYLASGILFNINCKCFGIFCLFGTLLAISFGAFFLASGSVLLGCLWLIWSCVWAFSFVGFACDKDFMIGTYLMFLIQGFFALFIVGLLILLGIIVL